MALSDARGVPTSATNPRSLEILETAIRQFQIYRGDAVETIDRALADDPDFVAGHIFRTEMHMMLWEKSVMPEVEAGLGRLKVLAGKATERERAHIGAIADWTAGDWEGMSARLDRIVRRRAPRRGGPAMRPSLGLSSRAIATICGAAWPAPCLPGQPGGSRATAPCSA